MPPATDQADSGPQKGRSDAIIRQCCRIATFPRHNSSTPNCRSESPVRWTLVALNPFDFGWTGQTAGSIGRISEIADLSCAGDCGEPEPIRRRIWFPGSRQQSCRHRGILRFGRIRWYGRAAARRSENWRNAKNGKEQVDSQPPQRWSTPCCECAEVTAGGAQLAVDHRTGDGRPAGYSAGEAAAQVFEVSARCPASGCFIRSSAARRGFWRQSILSASAKKLPDSGRGKYRYARRSGGNRSGTTLSRKRNRSSRNRPC